MAESKTLIRTFNRGLVSQLALARTDLERVPLSADTMNNWMPRNLGSMMLRPGTAYIGNTASNNKARVIPFIFSTDDTALIEITDSTMRVWVDDALVTRPSVSTTITNGDFTSGSGGWTDNDESGGTSTMNVAVGSERYLQLEGDGTNAAIRTQEVTVAGVDQGVEHGLLVEVGLMDYTGDVYNALKPTLRIGSSEGADDYVAEVQLDNGHHHFAFTPTGNFWIEWSNRGDGYANVRTTDIDSSGVMSITSLWTETDLSNIRYDQSGDVIYLACVDVPPCKILRYDSGSRSWGVALYEPPDGPFETINTGPKELTPSTAAGPGSGVDSGTADFWESTDKGRLVRVDSVGQRAARTVSADDQWTTTYIKVTGVTDTRIFTVKILDTWTGTISLQRSMTDPDQTANWEEVNTWTSNITTTYDDGLDNTTAWYRIGFGSTPGWSSGQAQVFLEYEFGSSIGVGRIWNVDSTTSVSTITLDPFGNTTASKSWYLGAWSETSGYPSSVAFAEGRLCWAGKNKLWLSVSDNYESFDIDTIGDSGPITRTIGSGPVDHINWMLGLKRLCFGTDSIEWNLRSSNEDEPLTPSNSIPRKISTQGSAEVHGLMLDRSGLFVQRGGTRLMEVAFNTADYEFDSIDLSTLYPESGGDSKIVRIALQRQPDTRIHCVREDGTVALLLHDKAENISCWVTLSTSGSTQSPDINISTISYDSVALAADTVGDVLWSEDGDRLFTLNIGLDAVYEWETEEWGLTDASRNTNSFDFTGQTSSAQSISLGDSGTKMYLAEAIDQFGYQYNLGTANNIGTMKYEGDFFDFSNEISGTLRSVSWKEDGTKAYALDSTNDEVYQYSASTAWDIKSLDYDSVAIDVSGIGAQPLQHRITRDGRFLFVLDISLTIHQFDFGTPWDGETITDPGLSFDTSAQTTSLVSGFDYAPATSSGTIKQHRFYVPSRTNNEIYQYSGDTWDTGASVVEDVAILPGGDGDGEDAVYYEVKRLINGVDVRFLEKWSLESENQGSTTSKQLDAHITGTVSGGVLTGLSHLEGENISVWANGKDVGTYTVSGGQITGVTEDGSAIAGLRYMAQFKSTKLGNLTMKKQASRLGLILRNTHYQGIEYGVDFDNLDPLPLVKDESIIDEDTIHTTFDEESFSLDGVWEADARLCLQAESPRPVTVLAAIIDLEE